MLRVSRSFSQNWLSWTRALFQGYELRSPWAQLTRLSQSSQSPPIDVYRPPVDTPKSHRNSENRASRHYVHVFFQPTLAPRRITRATHQESSHYESGNTDKSSSEVTLQSESDRDPGAPSKNSATSTGPLPDSPHTYAFFVDPEHIHKMKPRSNLRLGRSTTYVTVDQVPNVAPSVPENSPPVALRSDNDEVETLSVEQMQVLSLALDGASLYIGGNAGTGKSYLLRQIISTMEREQKLRVAVTAATGIAALNIGGNTFHSTFGLSVLSDSDEMAGKTLSPHSRRFLHHSGSGHSTSVAQHRHRATPTLHFDVDTLRQLDVIIIDEVSMLHAAYLESLERACRKTPGKDANRPFGGIQIILSGDFMQLMPLQKGRVHDVDITAALPSGRKDCLVCQRVEPKNSSAVNELSTTLSAPDVASSMKHTGRGDETDTLTINRSMAKRRTKKKHCEKNKCVPTAKPLRRRGMRHYVKLPMYNSYVFQKHLVHVQLTQPARHRGDTTFARELNLLREGVLPYRISRSAYVNPEDPTAIRLFVNKNRVRTFNETRMMMLTGEEREFRSELTITPTSKVPQRRNLAFVPPRPENHVKNNGTVREDADLSDPLVIQLFAVSRHPSLPSRVTYAEARTVLLEVCAAAKIDTRGLHLFVLPPSSRYRRNVTQVAVRCSATSKAGADRRMEQLRREALRFADKSRAILPCSLDRLSGTRLTTIFKKRKASSMFRSHPHIFLLQCYAFTVGQLTRIASPDYQRGFQTFAEGDYLLQNKKLKIGCRVMLLRNLNKDLPNGSIGTVVSFQPLSSCVSLLPKELRVQLPPSHFGLSIKGVNDNADEDEEVAERVARPHKTRKQYLNAREYIVAADVSAGDEQEQADELSNGVAAGGNANAVSSTDKLEDHHYVVPVVHMETSGALVAIPYMNFPLVTEQRDGFFRVRATCMPLTPAYAFTVHKVQGITLDHNVLFDASNMFHCNHMVYVAASRVRTYSQLRITNLSPKMITVHLPSLTFSRSLPDATQALETWRSRAAANKDQEGKSVTDHGLFDPLWKKPTSDADV